MPTPKLNEAAKSIVELCSDARDKYTPDDANTYCNLAVRFVCHNFAEYTGFSKMLANQMHIHMENTPEWAKVDEGAAKRLADDGKLVIASRRDQPHGHCAVVLPGRALVNSGKWCIKVPVVSNVGRRNWICGANYAFKYQPSYFTLIQDV